MELSFLRASENHKVKVNCRFQWMDLSIAIHDLKMLSESALDGIILIDKGNSLMIDHTVHYRFSRKEPSVHKEVPKRDSSHSKELIGTNLV